MSDWESPFFPQFELDSDSDVEAAYLLITGKIDGASLAARLERGFKERHYIPGRSAVISTACGVAILIMRRLLIQSLVEKNPSSECLSRLYCLADRLADFYDISSDWLPPRMLLRKALALTVAWRKVIEQMECQLVVEHPLPSFLGEACTLIDGDPFLLSDEDADELLAICCGG